MGEEKVVGSVQKFCGAELCRLTPRGARGALASHLLEGRCRTKEDAQAWGVRCVALCLLVYHSKGITTSQRPARSAVSHASTA